jgi:hypothetical protein
MYACEMQICCYYSVKYLERIKFHFYHRDETIDTTITEGGNGVV